jgi:hypothetical protein
LPWLDGLKQPQKVRDMRQQVSQSIRFRTDYYDSDGSGLEVLMVFDAAIQS